MRFLADENLEYPVITFLKDNNLDIVAVRDIMKGATDTEIIEYAFNNRLLIITSDKDFGELTFRLQRPNFGIILLRLSETDISEKAKILLAAIKTLDDEAFNKFIVIDKFKIRFRSLI